MAYKKQFESLSKIVPHTESWIASSMPRGGLQIVQPATVSESLLKPYAKEFHLEDAATWRAILEGRILRAADVWPSGPETSKYFEGFMRPTQLRYLAVAPLAGAVLEGYPSALHVYRTVEQGDFSAEDLVHIGEIASEIDNVAAQTRASRQPRDCSVVAPWEHRPAFRQFAFDAGLEPLLNDNLSVLDERVKDQLVQDAKQRLQNLNGELIAADRVALPDSSGDLWTFRVVVYQRYPALTEGSAVFYCLEPQSCDWQGMRAIDVQADAELARLVPAVQFMQEEFHRGPTLPEIARTVHLSPFHFHRRFSELLGITPKHFLLECQISAAKLQLVSGDKDLVEIASGCGFAHQSHFTSRFKQATGLTPTRWRRLALKLQTPVNN